MTFIEERGAISSLSNWTYDFCLVADRFILKEGPKLFLGTRIKFVSVIKKKNTQNTLATILNTQAPYSLLKIKVLHDAIEEPFCLNGSIKNL